MKETIVKILLVLLTFAGVFQDQGEQLRDASFEGRVSVVAQLLSEGAAVDSTDNYGRTALSIAAGRGHAEVMERLIAAGADLESTDRFYGFTPLTAAINGKQPAAVELLIKAGAENLSASLRFAASGDSATLKALLQAKDLQATDLRAALALARTSKNTANIELLIPIIEQLPDSEPMKEDKDSTAGADSRSTRSSDDRDTMKLGEEDQEDVIPVFQDYSFDGPNWPMFRGPMSRGVASHQSLPDEWDLESGTNIIWKAPIDGLGLSCPVVWDNAVYVSTAVSANDAGDDATQLRTGLYGDVDSVDDDQEYRFQLWRLSLETGEVIWKRDCNQAIPQVKRHAKSSHANPTPATNGKLIVTSFASEGVYCHDSSGELVWQKNFGFLDSGWFFDRSFQWGFASSPCIFDDTVYLQCDIQQQSFIVALNLQTGEELWRTQRDDIPTWSSPVAYRDPMGGLRVAVNGTREAALYDGTNGERIWSLSGMSEIVVPTPQVTPGYVMLSSGYRPVRPMIAVTHDARGALSAENEAESEDDREGFQWSLQTGGPYLPTPVIVDGFIHVVSNSGILSVHHAQTGKRLSRVRLPGAGSCTGSPVAADGKMYVTAENGKTFVVPVGPDQEPLSINEVGESVLTSPAISRQRLLIRGEKHLFAIGKPGGSKIDEAE